MYCHYIGWYIGKCPLYRGVHYSECPLSEVPLYLGWQRCPVYRGVLISGVSLLRGSTAHYNYVAKSDDKTAPFAL